MQWASVIGIRTAVSAVPVIRPERRCVYRRRKLLSSRSGSSRRACSACVRGSGSSCGGNKGGHHMHHKRAAAGTPRELRHRLSLRLESGERGLVSPLSTFLCGAQARLGHEKSHSVRQRSELSSIVNSRQRAAVTIWHLIGGVHSLTCVWEDCTRTANVVTTAAVSDSGRFSSVATPIDGGAVLLRLGRCVRHIVSLPVARPAHSEEEQVQALGIIIYSNHAVPFLAVLIDGCSRPCELRQPRQKPVSNCIRLRLLRTLPRAALPGS
jgi:hypothetical protein